MSRRRTLIAICLWVAAAALGCGPPEERYELEGRVVAVDVEGGKVTVDHEAVPGFMDAMTMPFRVVDPRLLPNMQEGDRLRAALVVKGNASWLEEVVVQPSEPERRETRRHRAEAREARFRMSPS